DHRHHATQEQVHFVKLRKPTEGPGTHQAEVGVIFDDIHAHELQELVVHARCKPLSEAVYLARLTHPVNNVTPFVEGLNHILHHFRVVLQIGIQADRDIATDRHQSSQQCCLMAKI